MKIRKANKAIAYSEPNLENDIYKNVGIVFVNQLK